MAPSVSSTVTASPAKRKAASPANGSAANLEPVEPVDESLPRDPLEVKYKDFFWTYTEEPHRTRRLAIIKAHPEVNSIPSFL